MHMANQEEVEEKLHIIEHNVVKEVEHHLDDVQHETSPREEQAMTQLY